MLGYTLFVLIRFFLRYRLARREFTDLRSGSDSGSDFHRNGRTLIVDLSRGLGTLRGIAYAAPFLGLAGTSYGILAAFSYPIMGSRASVINFLIERIALTLTTTAVGVLVATAAILLHNFLRARTERYGARWVPRRNSHANDLGSFQLAQTLPLKMRFSGPPHFALLAAPFWLMVLMVYLVFKPYPTLTGLRVALVPEPCEYRATSLIMLRLANDGKVFINEEQADWKDLGSRLFAIYTYRYSRELYLYAEDGVPFQSVADAIEIARNVPAAGQDSPDIKVILITPMADRECGFIPIRIIPVKHALR
jgi:biopolymer transport protein ExbD